MRSQASWSGGAETTVSCGATEPLFGLKKAEIDGTAAQALKEGSQALLVVRSDRPDVDRATIA
jgi:hypothetical protein